MLNRSKKNGYFKQNSPPLFQLCIKVYNENGKQVLPSRSDMRFTHAQNDPKQYSYTPQLSSMF